MKTSRAAIVIGLAIPLISIIYLGADLILVGRAPDKADWKEAAGSVRSQYKAGDLVVFSPQWAQAASPWLQGLKVDTGENSDWYEASKSNRVWVIGSMGGRNPDLPDGWKQLSKQDFDKVTVHLWEPPSNLKVTYSFRDRIGDALVSRLHPKRREVCSNLKDNRWYCGRVHPWLYVGHESKDISGRVRDIIWAHSVDKATLEAAWPKVPGGKVLTVHYGLTQRAVESREGGPVKFRIIRNNVPVFEDVLEPGEGGWFRKDFTIDGVESEVRFQISTPNAQSRQLCFTADVWDAK